MIIVRQEALNKRARKLFSIPLTIEQNEFNNMPGNCPADLLAFYSLVGGVYELNTPISSLSIENKFEILECLGRPNGFKMVLVKLIGGQAELDVYFYNRNYFKQIQDDFDLTPDKAYQQFPISGGHRILAGECEGQVRVVGIADQGSSTSILKLTVEPIGDYSTYTLAINTATYPAIDPVFSEIGFKFRPGCFNTDCRPDWDPVRPPSESPVIDYLAKDYDSFRHTMMTAMSTKVPGWEPTSEADLDQVLLELFSVAADELSDYQDRVMNEAYLGTARKRVSLARHARLMDYHIHQGNQASTWLVLNLINGQETEVNPDFQVATGDDLDRPENVVFMSRGLFSVDGAYKNELDGFRVSDSLIKKFASHNIELSSDLSVDIITAGSKWIITDNDFHQSYMVTEKSGHLAIYEQWFLSYLLNGMKLYTWGDSKPALAVNSTQADLLLIDDSQAAAIKVQEAIRDGKIKYFLLQEWRDPLTGKPAGTDPNKRQLLRLIPGEGDKGAKVVHDPLENKYLIRVFWQDEDALKHDYCFSIDCPSNVNYTDVSLFHGNLIKVYHGRSIECIFKHPDELLADEGEYHFEIPETGGKICRLHDGPLAYLETSPGGEHSPLSTLEVSVTIPGAGVDKYDEVISLIHSDNTDEMGDHFIVETDELGESLIRFGNGINGKELADDAVVSCRYQIGLGPAGNIGADKLTYFPDSFKLEIEQCWNPFDVTNGCSPEPAAEIIRRVPEAYLSRQLRAITLNDYKKRAEELAEVQKAHAAYAWTGSWRTVRLTIDPLGSTEINDDDREKLARHLDAVRLIGEDLEIRPPRWVPLDILVVLCVHQDYWPEDIKHLLEQEFSDGWTPDGRMAFFHPDRWTFGQGIRESQILGGVHKVEGIDHVISVTLKRFNEVTPGFSDRIEVRPTEIILVKNDPDHMENGIIEFDVKGGRV